MTAIKIKTVPMLTLVASLSAGLMFTAAESAFARNHNGNNNGNGGNKNFSNNDGNSKFNKKDYNKYSDKKKKDQPGTAGMTQGTSTQSMRTTARASNSVQGNTASQSSPLTTTSQNVGAGATPKTGATGNTVIISNGVNKVEMKNGPGGVAVYSDKSGKITVTNGKESQTLNGGSITLSGNVVGVGGSADNVQIGKRNGEGNVVVSIPPAAPKPAPTQKPKPGTVTGGPEGGFLHALGSGVKDLFPPYKFKATVHANQ